MTGAAGFFSSSLAFLSGLDVNTRQPGGDGGDGSELGKLFEFADLFRSLDKDQSIFGVEPPQNESGGEADDPDSAGDAGLVELTHQQWFRPEQSAADDLPLRERKPAPIMRPKTPIAPALESDALSTASLPFGAEDWLDGFDPNIHCRGSKNASEDDGIQHSQGEEIAPILPHEIAEILARTDLPLKDRPRSASVESNCSALAGFAKPQLPAERFVSPAVAPDSEPKADEPASTNLRASLSALQAALASCDFAPPADQEIPGEQLIQVARAIRQAGNSLVRQESHLDHSPSQPLAQQIAQHIDHEVQNLLNEPVSQQGAPHTADRAPAHVMHLQLDPPRLGTIKIHISLQSEAVRLQLETQNFETAKLIKNEKESLSNLLCSAGYIVDSIGIQFSPTG